MIYNLQALRAIAALLVVFVHLEALLWSIGAIPFGWSGVDLFFVISGFVMVHTTRAKPTTPWAFAKNRIARIVPIYWLLTVGVFAVAFIAPNLVQATTADPLLLLKSLLFIPFQKPNGLVQPTLFVGWTLNYEMFFYALFALGLAFRRTAAGVGFVSAVIAGLVVAGVVWPPSGVAAAFYSNPIMLEFVLGMGIALLEPRIPAATGSATRWAVLATVVVAFVIVVAAPLIAPQAPRLTTAGLPAALVVAGAIALERWGWRTTNRALIVLGDASYVLYLSHPFVTQAIIKATAPFAPRGVVAAMVIVLGLTIVCLVAVGLHFWVERPLSLAARRWLAPARPPAQEAAKLGEAG